MHQIRKHLASLGFPISNDFFYNAARRQDQNSFIFLHCLAAALHLPSEQELKRFEAQEAEKKKQRQYKRKAKYNGTEEEENQEGKQEKEESSDQPSLEPFRRFPSSGDLNASHVYHLERSGDGQSGESEFFTSLPSWSISTEFQTPRPEIMPSHWFNLDRPEPESEPDQRH